MGRELSAQDARFELEHGSFANLSSYIQMRQHQQKVAGVLLDLGVSSPQLDQAERGFSFMNDGPLDMRMNPEAGMSAADWINSAKQEDLAWVFKEYGEERFAKRIARAIVTRRTTKAFTRTKDFAQVVAEAHPAWEKHKHPATRVFQATRIHINDELDDVKCVLQSALDMLQIGGRLVVISFHSLEDRLVKRFIRDQEKGDQLPPGLPVMESQLNKRIKSIGKARKASAAEVNDNVRSRSAIMRVAEKIQ